jgi:xanthine dehydrogenase YagS FAD-binding subunit
MHPLAYARAVTVDDATEAAAQDDTALLAGGTELLNWMRLGVERPARVVDIARIEGLDRIEELPGGGLRIGATARLNDVAADPRVASGWPLLSEAIHRAASAQLRNLATIGGNLLQKTRCAYFRAEEPVPCNRRQPGSGCSALHGRSDRHALFGWTGDCGATHPADPAVAFAAVDAEVVTRTARGGRRIPVNELYVLPGERLDVDTVLEPGELIEAIEMAAPAPRSAYLKVRERTSYEYALVSVAATVALDGAGMIATARVALGSVALRPWRLHAAESGLVGLAPGDPAVGGVFERALAGQQAFGESGYKARLAVNAARRALRMAAEESP